MTVTWYFDIFESEFLKIYNVNLHIMIGTQSDGLMVVGMILWCLLASI